MKSPFYHVLMMLLLGSISIQKAAAQKMQFDLSGLPLFWEIVDRLQVDQINFPNAESDDYLLLHANAGLLEEGIACMLDKKHYPQMDMHSVGEEMRPIISTFNKAFANTPNTLKQIDQWLQQIHQDPSKTAEFGKMIHGSLTWGGHPDGMYMAMAIEKALGRKKLVAANDNSFEFFLLYHKAAKKLKGEYHQFSKESLKLVRSLKKKYQ